MKKIITKTLVIIFSVGMIVSVILNLFLQIYQDTKTFQERTREHFWRIERSLEENEENLAKLKADFAEECIVRARAAAYTSEHYPEMIDDLEECKKVAALLSVDELHFFTTEGVIYAGTHPEYYDFSFSSGEQMAFFAPLLKDRSLELCQDITPNTAEQKLMQYAAVWSPDGKRIVQVGLNPERVLKEIEGNDISGIFSVITTDRESQFYAVDAANHEIIGSTDRKCVGKRAEESGFAVDEVSGEISWDMLSIEGEKQYCAMKRADDLILVKSCPLTELYSGLLINTVLLCCYFLLLFLLLVISTYILLDRKIVRSIVNINKSLQDIERGKWDTVLVENSTSEFAQLSGYINSMVTSLLHFSKKVSKALEISEVPIGICEYEPGINKFTATSRVNEILMMSEQEFNRFMENPELFLQKMQVICREEMCLGDSIYRMDGSEERYLRVENFDYQKSRMTILIDVTADIREKLRITEERDTDLLTGLNNRRAFYRDMDRLFASPEQLKHALMAVIDLDKMKMVNDLYGHSEGDKYLIAFAEFLNSCKAENKIVARMGGDEFVLFVYGYDEEEKINEVIAELLSFRGSHAVIMASGEAVRLEYSMGWAFYPREEENYQVLMGLADKRMYEAKKLRKGRDKA